MTKKKKAFIFVALFLLYIMLATINVLYKAYNFRKFYLIVYPGAFIDYFSLDAFFMPGWLVTYVTTNSMVGMFIGEIITFLIGTVIIFSLFKINLRELADDFNNLIKRGPRND
jgi:hypothetical protein